MDFNPDSNSQNLLVIRDPYPPMYSDLAISLISMT